LDHRVEQDLQKIPLTKSIRAKATSTKIDGINIDLRFKVFCDFDAYCAYFFSPMLGATLVSPELFAESCDPHCKQKQNPYREFELRNEDNPHFFSGYLGPMVCRNCYRKTICHHWLEYPFMTKYFHQRLR